MPIFLPGSAFPVGQGEPIQVGTIRAPGCSTCFTSGGSMPPEPAPQVRSAVFDENNWIGIRERVNLVGKNFR